MDPIKQRIALAELEGWIQIYEREGKLWGIVPNADEFDSQGALENCYQVPDYLNDRNALTRLLELDKNYLPKVPFNLANYIYELARILNLNGDEYGFDTGEIYLIHTATPAQCCEALLKVTGKWKE